VVASTRGNKETDIKIDGKPVIIGLNAYIRKSVLVMVSVEGHLPLLHMK